MSESSAEDLTTSELRALQARAHALEPVVLIGDKGLTGAVLAEIDRALAAHELIKIRVQAGRDGRQQMLGEICDRTKGSAVQHIGKVLVVFRKKPPQPASKPAAKSKLRKVAPRMAPARIPEERDRAMFGRPRRPSTATGRQKPHAATGTGRPESRTALPRPAPSRPPGRRRTSR